MDELTIINVLVGMIIVLVSAFGIATTYAALFLGDHEACQPVEDEHEFTTADDYKGCYINGGSVKCDFCPMKSNCIDALPFED